MQLWTLRAGCGSGFDLRQAGPGENGECAAK